jgi:hypothetical protein
MRGWSRIRRRRKGAEKGDGAMLFDCLEKGTQSKHEQY